MSNIYQITSKTSGKSYVGKTTKPILTRWVRHIRNAKSGMTTHLANAIRLYGEEDFIVELLEIVGDVEVDERERFWIAHLHTKQPSGYNMTDGGEGTHGYIWTDDDPRHISNGGMSMEQRDKISRSSKGIPKSDAARQHLSEAKKGKPLSEAHKQAVSDGFRRRRELKQEQE